VARIALEASGYIVLQAADGEEALRLTDGRPPVDILVTDVVMPGMSGRELADAYRLRHPEVRVLFTSGYTADAVIRDDSLGPHAAFLQKPYTPLAIAGKVREVLDS
jgi:CheY-like chemotaxis protein